MRPIRPATLLLSCALLAACTDRGPLAPVPGSPAGPTSPAAQKVECVARVREQTVTCGAPGSAAARGNIYGGQGQNVKLTTTSVSWDAGTGTFGGTVTVQNLLPYALGVHEGMEADSGGVKVFFVSGPTATAGSGTVTVQNADGTGVLTAAGQPFFKYAQALAPQQVSDPRSWLFHLDAGVTAFSFAVYVSAAQQPSAFRIVAPRANDTIPPDSVVVEVIANAPPATTSIRAQLGAVQSFLEYAGDNRWKGRVWTLGVDSRVLMPLKIVAVSPLDSLAQTVYLYNPNHAPVLRLTAPLLGFVVRDTTALRVAGTCVTAGTDNPCTVTARVGSGPAVSTTGSSFDFTMVVPGSGTLRVTARDAHGSSGNSVDRTLIVETSPLLQEVASAGSQVWGGNADFLLYSGDSLDASVRSLRLRDRATGSEVTLRADIGARSIEHVSFTPTGVVFGITGFGADSLLEYRNGVLSHLGNGYAVQVEGQWMLWATPDSTLYLRDLAAGSTTPVATKAWWPDVAANGDVVFEQQKVVKRYRAGVITPIGPGEAPKTDGNLVVYTSPWSDPWLVHPSDIQYVYLYDGSDTTRLAGGYNSTPSPYVHDTYAVRNGWVFYNSLGPSGGYQLFSRAPDGTIRPVSTEGPMADFEIPYGMEFPLTLGDHGEVLYSEYDSTVSFYSAPPYDVRTAVDRYEAARLFGKTTYFALGRSLFEVVP